jgi:tRNA threonylcarbamoyl adenosine modification protein YeaZ
MKNILGIDTSGVTTVIGINDEIISWESIRNQSKELLPRIDELLKSQKIKPEQLKGVVVNIGPGSFTGLRVGVTIANGFGYGLKIPVKGITEFDVVRTMYNKADWIVLDARRGELFVQYKKTKPVLMEPAKFGKAWKKGERVYIDDYRLIPLLHDQLKDVGTIYIPNLCREEKMAVMLTTKPPKTFKQVLPIYLRGANITLPTKSRKRVKN